MTRPIGYFSDGFLNVAPLHCGLGEKFEQELWFSTGGVTDDNNTEVATNIFPKN